MDIRFGDQILRIHYGRGKFSSKVLEPPEREMKMSGIYYIFPISYIFFFALFNDFLQEFVITTWPQIESFSSIILIFLMIFSIVLVWRKFINDIIVMDHHYVEVKEYVFNAEYQEQHPDDIIGVYWFQFNSNYVFEKLTKTGEILVNITKMTEYVDEPNYNYTIPVLYTRDKKIKIYYPLDDYQLIQEKIDEADLFHFTPMKIKSFYMLKFEEDQAGKQLELDIDGKIYPYS